MPASISTIVVDAEKHCGHATAIAACSVHTAPSNAHPVNDLSQHAPPCVARGGERKRGRLTSRSTSRSPFYSDSQRFSRFFLGFCRFSQNCRALYRGFYRILYRTLCRIFCAAEHRTVRAQHAVRSAFSPPFRAAFDRVRQGIVCAVADVCLSPFSPNETGSR